MGHGLGGRNGENLQETVNPYPTCSNFGLRVTYLLWVIHKGIQNGRLADALLPNYTNNEMTRLFTQKLVKESVSVWVGLAAASVLEIPLIQLPN